MTRAGVFLAAYVALIGVLLFAPMVAHAATPPIIDIPSITVMENAGSAPVVIVKAKASSYSKISVQSVDGTAKAGVDYAAVNQTLTLANTAISAKLPIPIIDNSTYQGPRSFLLKLTILRFGQVAPSMSPITVTITDDEAPLPPPPAPAVTWTRCADENGTCSVVGTASVRYGAGTTWTAARLVTGSIACNNATWGDPAVGTAKECDTDGIVAAPAPPPAPNGLAGETAIADNFDYAAAVVPTTYGPNGGAGIPSATAINDLGAFRLDCGPGQLLKDDPIVLSGQAGTSHLHQFIGNLGTNAFSTYSSLRTTGGSTCGLINRSAYWTPAMIGAPGMALKPDHILIYYKRFPAGGPGCVGPMAVGICTDLPNGLRFVTGYNMKTMTGGPAGIGTRDYWSMDYNCWSNEANTVPIPAAAQANFHTIADVVAAGCPAGARLHVSIEAPTCWDGKNLDTADHRSHIVYPPDGTDKGMGYVCPADHPYVIPMMSVQLFYNTDANFVAGKWHLASDEPIPGVAAGTTLHMDYFEAWSPTAKSAWMANCINKPASCSGGDLGNGTAIIGGTEPYPAGWPKQVPVPVTP